MIRQLVISAIILTAALQSGYAQTTDSKANKAIRKERVSQEKFLDKEIEAKATKTARKEAKRLAKEGWRPSPGKMPLEAQLNKVYRKQYETTENGHPKYYVGNSSVSASDYTTAQKQAIEYARQNVVEQLKSETKEIIETNINALAADGEAKSLREFVSKGITEIGQKLYRLPIDLDACREVNGKTEVMLMVTCPTNQVLKTLLEEIPENRGKLVMKSILEEW